MNDRFKVSLENLKSFIEKEDYKGYDPYDALKSPLLNLPLIRNSRNIRFLAQQLVKRSPVNLRPLLFIKKGLNPVTLGLCLQAYVDMNIAGLMSDDEAETKCNKLMGMLETLIPNGYSGVCWGYDFPWQSRHFTLGPFQPSIVATGIITNALYRYYLHSKNNKAFDLCRSSCDFILNDLNRFENKDSSICFSYTPYDHYLVYNASLKGARTLAQVFSVTGEKLLLETARLAVQYVAANQNADGSWYYAAGAKGKWIDNYHTGYILECMDEYMIKTGDTSFTDQLQKGIAYYVSTFFEQNRIPKFFNNQTYPIDCTSGAQAILTLCRVGKMELAEAVATFMIETMQSENGSFYFRAYKNHTIKTSFMRWSNSWMFAALARMQSISS